MIVPGYVGARQVKWLSRIVLSEDESEVRRTEKPAAAAAAASAAAAAAAAGAGEAASAGILYRLCHMFSLFSLACEVAREGLLRAQLLPYGAAAMMLFPSVSI